MSGKSSTRYFIFLILIGLFFYFTNDFGLVGAQKTAIVTAIGIEKEEEGFALSVQIANPSKNADKNSKQGGQGSEYPVFESKGRTVAEAVSGVEKATGWQVKLVFCRLLVLGETLVNEDCFSAIGYFLLNEYMNENCLVACANGEAGELIKAQTPLGASSALAVEKLLSPTAKRAGTAYPVNLKDFCAKYYEEGSFALLPVLEKDGERLKAEKTALLKHGKKVAELSVEESFALSVATLPLRLASYTANTDGVERTLTIRKSDSKRVLRFEGATPVLNVTTQVYAGIEDNAKPMPAEALKDAGCLSKATLLSASERLRGQMLALHEKCKAVGFDIFGCTELLHKYSFDRYEEQKQGLVERLEVQISVSFEGVR